MNNTNVVLAVCVVASAVLLVKPASACSVPESETLPSNFGLVEMADMILLAEAMADETRSRVMVPERS